VRFPGEPHPDESGGRRHAGVLLLFDPASDQLPLLFTLRSADLRFHAGQIAFPGGTSEKGDTDIVATALREAHEEVGVAPANVDVIGILPPLVTAMSDRWLTPVVGLQRAPFEVVTDASEVAEWFRVDLTTLLTAPHEVREFVRDELRRDVHYYHVASRVIWGVTAAILHELLTRLGRED
jgi:8-oxo-dGTP pyrophosphatase MutT (NUDIX family)